MNDFPGQPTEQRPDGEPSRSATARGYQALGLMVAVNGRDRELTRKRDGERVQLRKLKLDLSVFSPSVFSSRTPKRVSHISFTPQ